MFFLASSITTITRATPIRIPGTIPAVNISAIDTPVIDAYTTNAILGGITIAIELEVAISAVENGAENPPRSIIAGISTIPNAATVAGPEPEIAPKKQATITHTIAIPPLVCPTQVSTKRIRRLEIPAFAMILPDNTKNGIASNRNLLIPEYILVATIVSEVPEYRIAQIDDNPRQIPIGIPRIRNTKNETNNTALIIFPVPPYLFYSLHNNQQNTRLYEVPCRLLRSARKTRRSIPASSVRTFSFRSPAE